MANNPTVSNGWGSNNPDFVVEAEDQGSGVLRQVVNANAPKTSSVTEVAVNVTTSSSTILASNSSRRAGWLINLSDTTIYVSFGSTATTSKIPVFQYGTLPLSCNGINYTGAVNAIHAGTGSKGVLIQWC
jgi:hypothetical protein